MQSVIGALRVVLGADTAQFEDGMKRAQQQMAAAGKRMEAVGASMMKVGAGLSVAVTAPLVAMGVKSVQAAQEANAALGQVEARLKSMGPAAGRSSEQLQTLAAGLERVSGVDDDEILRGLTANLLTFGNVAGPNFDRAQAAILDMASALKMDLQPATMMVGKALNDPAKGLAALRRVGIQFTAQQEKQIAAMLKAKNAAGAQAIMLAELERQFGGSAAAMKAADPWADLRISMSKFQEAVGALLLEVLPPLTAFLTKLVEGFNTLSPGMQRVAVIGAAVAAALGPVLVAMGGLVSVVGGLAPMLPALFAPLLPVLGPVAVGVAAAVAAFLLFRDEVEPALRAFWATASEALGPGLQQLFTAVKGLVTTVGAAFRAFADSEAGQALRRFQQVYLSVLGQGLLRVLSAVVQAVTGAINIVTNIFTALSRLLSGDFSGAWRAWQAAGRAAWTAIGNIVQALAPEVVALMKRLYEGVKTWLVDKFTDIVNGVRQKIDQVKGFFFDLYDAVVGHSYIPDMVNGVAAWMAKLDAAMAVPAKNATKKTKEAFKALKDDVGVLMESLLTDTERSAREMAQKLDLIERGRRAGILSASEAEDARSRAWRRDDLDRGEDVRVVEDDRFAGMHRKPLEELGRINDAIHRAAADAENRWREAARTIGGHLMGAFEEFVDTGKLNWRRLVNDLLRDWSKVVDVIRQAFSAFGQARSGGGGFWSSVASAATSMFGGKKIPGYAGGTDFAPGGLAWVGERGRELVNLPRGSQVIPESRLGPARGGMTLSIHVDARDAVLTKTVQGWVAEGMQQAITAANQQAPGIVFDAIERNHGIG